MGPTASVKRGSSPSSASSSPAKPAPLDLHSETVVHELQLTSELLLLSARVGKALLAHQQSDKSESCSLEELSPTFKTDAANKLLSLIEQFRAHWLTRYQAHGMQGSLLAMGALLAKFIPEETDVLTVCSSKS